MTDSNLFFKLIWRTNGVILLLVLCLAVYQLLDNIIFKSSTLHQSSVVNFEDKQKKIFSESWSFDYWSQVSGTPYLMLALKFEQEYEYSSKFSSSDRLAKSTRNYLFVNTQNKDKQNWVFANNKNLIIDADFLSKSDENKNRIVIAILYQIAKSDTDGDNRLTKGDLTSIGLSKPDGTSYKNVLENIDTLLKHMLIFEKTLFLLYKKNGDTFVEYVDLSTFTNSHKMRLPNQNDL